MGTFFESGKAKCSEIKEIDGSIFQMLCRRYEKPLKTVLLRQTLKQTDLYSHSSSLGNMSNAKTPPQSDVNALCIQISLQRQFLQTCKFRLLSSIFVFQHAISGQSSHVSVLITSMTAFKISLVLLESLRSLLHKLCKKKRKHVSHNRTLKF